METLQRPPKEYLVFARYIFRHGRVNKSELVRLNRYDTRAEAERAVRGMNLRKMAKDYKLRGDDRLLELRIEGFVMKEGGEKRFKANVLTLAEHAWG
ncbi:MAG: hypothetical protein WAM91_08225 [Candidatus Acidiferrales bacterium]